MTASSALVLIDVLKGIFELGQPLHEPDALLASLERLLQVSRERDQLVVHVRHEAPAGPFAAGTPGAEFHLRLAPRAGELVVPKTHPDAFHDTTLEQTLRDRSIDTLWIGGFATEGCIDATVRSAYRLGFEVVLIADGHTTTRNEVLEARQIVAHHNAVLRRFAAVRTAGELVEAGSRSA